MVIVNYSPILVHFAILPIGSELALQYTLTNSMGQEWSLETLYLLIWSFELPCKKYNYADLREADPDISATLRYQRHSELLRLISSSCAPRSMKLYELSKLDHLE